MGLKNRLLGKSARFESFAGLMNVTVILSNFGENERIRHFYEKAASLLKERPARQQAKADRAMPRKPARTYRACNG